MDDGHIEEILGSSNMRAFYAIAKEDVGHDQKVHVRPMGGNNNDRPSFFLIVVSQLHYRVLIDHNLLVNRPEHFVKKPGECPDGFHRILGEHLVAHLLGNLVELGLHIFIGHGGLFQFTRLLLY